MASTVSPGEIAFASRARLAPIASAMLLASLGTSVANVLLPAVASDFAASTGHVQWVVLAYLLALTTFVVVAGRLGDLWGSRRLLLAGTALFTAASLACAVAPTLGILVAGRALQGLGAAHMMALAMALSRDLVPREKLGVAMGTLGTVSAVGTMLGPSLGGLLAATLGWRAAFLMLVPLGAATLFLTARAVPPQRSRSATPAPSFDRAGTIVLGLALLAYSLGFTVHAVSRAVNLALFAACAAALLLFLRIESRAPAPLVPAQAWSRGGLRASLAMNALVSTVMMATLVVGPFYLSRALGLDPTIMGLVMSVGPLVSIVAGIPAGRLVDRVGTRATVRGGLGAMAAGFMALAWLPASFGMAGYLLGIVVLTPGYQLFQAANNAASLADVPPDRRGVVSGLLTLSRNIGLITGASAMSALFVAAAGATDALQASAQAITAGFRTTFLVATVLVLSASALAAATRQRR